MIDMWFYICLCGIFYKYIGNKMVLVILNINLIYDLNLNKLMEIFYIDINIFYKY